MRVIYWMTPSGELCHENLPGWFEGNKVIPRSSWVFDPHIGERSESFKCGMKNDHGKWDYKSYADFPPEFKTYLLLLGVTL